MELSDEINLLNVAQMQVVSTEEGMPVLFKYGNAFKVDIRILFTFNPFGFLRMTKLRMEKGDKNTNIGVRMYASLNYSYIEDGKKILQTLETYMVSLDKQHMNNTLFESENIFHVNSMMLPSDQNIRETGNFELSLSWNLDEDEESRYQEVNIPLTIFEQFGLE